MTAAEMEAEFTKGHLEHGHVGMKPYPPTQLLSLEDPRYA
jgi:hypothetical protein